MRKWVIWNSQSGYELGVYEGRNEDEAIDAMLRDADCEDAPSIYIQATEILL